MTIGDVLAVIAGVLATGATLWASILVLVVLFPARTGRAGKALEERASRCLWTGAIAAFTVGLAAWVMAFSPGIGGLPKLLGWILLLLLLLVATLGSAGIAEVGAARIRQRDPRIRPLAALGKATGLMITAGLVPGLGWLVLFPLMLMVSLGAGFAALTGRVRAEVPALRESAG